MISDFKNLVNQAEITQEEDLPRFGHKLNVQIRLRDLHPLIYGGVGLHGKNDPFAYIKIVLK